MAFIAPSSIAEIPDTVPAYVHGFSEEEVIEIKKAKKLIEKRDLLAEPVTREEFRLTIVPWQRIHRTEEFNLRPVKPIKVPKVPKEKVVKEKKLTKKAIKERLGILIFRKFASPEELTEEDILFLAEHTEGA